MRTHPILAPAAISAVLALALTGCATSAPQTRPSSAAPTTEQEAGAGPAAMASPAAVAAGLRAIDSIARQLAAAGADKAKAVQLDEQIEPAWKQIEDTVKTNDMNSYLAFENAATVLENAATNGDKAAATNGSTAVTAAVQSYLAKYPG
ncbi:MAG TPA: hypothetical protein VIY28_02030 [Pseudonocardiaceae bacterium]